MSQAIAILKEYHLSVTKQRIQLLDFILNITGAFSIQNFDRFAAEIDTVTIYRFISLLLSKGLLVNIGEINGKNYYEYRMTDKSHPHFVCDECHQVKCLNCLSKGDLSIFKKYAPGSKAKEINIIIGGVCEKCMHNH